MLLTGRLHGLPADAPPVQVGAFSSPRIWGQPISWTTVQGDDMFRLAVPPGSWHLHAVAGPPDDRGFLTPTLWGSQGGIYGRGRPIPVCHYPVTGLSIHLSPLWRDLTHIPHHRQPALNAEQWRAVDTTIAALHADPHRPLGDLGGQAGLVRTRLATLFHRATGLTLTEYRTRLRLELAKALLAETEADILSVALEVGYATPAALGRVFQRYVGVAPGEFRRLVRAVPNLRPPAPATPGAIQATLERATASLQGSDGTIHGDVTYDGPGDGVALYVFAFPKPQPTVYPTAWLALSGPGPFTLRDVPPGRYYLRACWCRRRAEYPGDFRSAFAFATWGSGDSPQPVDLMRGETVSGLSLHLTEGDGADMAVAWTRAFLPDGR